MRSVLHLGRPLFGVGTAGLGFLSLLYQDPVIGLEPIPAGVPGRQLWAFLAAFILIASGVSLAVNWQARRGAGMLAVTLALWLVALHLPALGRYPGDPESLAAVAQTLALWGAACVLWSTLPEVRAGAFSRAPETHFLAKTGRICFGVSMLVLGIVHLSYHHVVSGWAPDWIPARALWRYVTAIAFIGAGLSIVTGAWARLAATLLGIMLGIWVLIGRWPQVVANLASQAEWMSLGTAMVLWGAALLIADSLAAETAGLGTTGSSPSWWPLARTSRTPCLRLPDPRIARAGRHQRAMSSASDDLPKSPR
jgi:hypothetical protein